MKIVKMMTFVKAMTIVKMIMIVKMRTILKISFRIFYATEERKRKPRSIDDR